MIFLLGLHKTGTSSLDEALNTLGYNVQQDVGTFFGDLSEDVCKQLILDNIEGTEARRGFPWNIYPEFLLEHFPDAKFILTIRDIDTWYASVRKNWPRERIPMHDFFYGDGPAQDCEAIYKQRYRDHVTHVIEVFKDRQDQLLVMDVVDGVSGWKELCQFLGKEVPDKPFPHMNKTPP